MLSSNSARATAWMSRGACQGEDPELFFPVASTGPFRDQINAAKAICGRCSELQMCLSCAVRTAQDGIWGGTTKDERRAMPSRERLPASAFLAMPLASGHADAGRPAARTVRAAAHRARRHPLWVSGGA
jgi:WhiB family transcriptional regulator, redox-sensing transcriptional regulator